MGQVRRLRRNIDPPAPVPDRGEHPLDAELRRLVIGAELAQENHGCGFIVALIDRDGQLRSASNLDPQYCVRVLRSMIRKQGGTP